MNSKITVIVQAGGRGSRLRHHTWNKPKCLVSVHGKPILYHLFDKFPEADFVVIGDYLFEQLKTYLEVNPPGVNYQLVQANDKGTASGISSALDLIPEDTPILLTWSDLIIHDLPDFTEATVPVVCTTDAFTCRWSVTEGSSLVEVPSATTGIPGIFYFPEQRMMPRPPKSGEFVRWLSGNLSTFQVVSCGDLEELGDFATIEESNERAGFCRFFNKVEISGDTVVKTVVDPAYQDVHTKEVQWYVDAKDLGFRRIPKVLSVNPLHLERIRGSHAFQMNDLTDREQRAVLADYLDTLTSLHDLAETDVVEEDVRNVYIQKTIQRVNSVARIIPGFHRESITINGKKCRNPFSAKHAGTIEGLLPEIMPDKFVPIHGDPTFSNSLIDDSLRVWFIDPRGYFAQPGIMGDPWYDFAKVYYSAVGGYDFFNRKKFKLHLDDETVEVLIEEPALARTAKGVFASYFGEKMKRIEILHGLIWLSLSGYAKDDVDSVIGSFYLGLYWLEMGRQMK